MAFKRASLNGSAQLFQPTRVPTGNGDEEAPEPIPLRSQAAVPPLPEDVSPDPSRGGQQSAGATGSQGHLYRLSRDDLERILEAIQHAKFPHSYQRLAKPAMEDFEELEALRQKLLDQSEGHG